MLKTIKGKFKKVIAGVLTAVTIFLSVFNTYSFPVYATEVAATFALTEELIALIQMFYASMGIVVPKEEIAASQLTNYFTDIMNAGTSELNYYGEALTVDWSDEESIADFLDLSMSRAMNFEVNLVEAYGPEASLFQNYYAMDMKCYELFGMTATEAIFGEIWDLKDENGKVIGQAAWSDATQSGYIMEYNKLGQMLHNFNNGDNGDDWKTKLKKFTAYGGLTLCLIAEAAGITNFLGAALTPTQTAFTEYTAESFGEFIDPENIYYDGNFVQDTNGNYLVNFAYHYKNWGEGVYENYLYTFDSLPVGVLTNTSLKIMSYNEGSLAVEKSCNYYPGCSISIPIFSDNTSALGFFQTGDDSACINKVTPFNVEAYQQFLDTVPVSGMPSSLINNVSASNYGINETAFNTLSEELEKIATVTEPSYTVGTEPGTRDLGTLFDDLKGDPIDDVIDPSIPGDSDVDPDIGGDITDGDEIGGTTSDYSGTLSDILGAITALPSQIFDAFKSMLETMNENIMQIPEDIKDFFRDPLTFIQDAFTELNDSVSDMFDFMKTMPAEIAQALNLQDVIDAVNATVFDPSSVIDSIGEFRDSVKNPLDDIVSTLKGILDGLPFAGSGVPTGGGGGSGEAETPGVEFGSLFSILILLILIILMLIVLFMNC